MNPFKAYEGITLNGKFYKKESLSAAAMSEEHPAYLREVFAFAAKVFDRTHKIQVSTSGSTGIPKKMDFPKTAFEASAKSTNAFFELNEKSTALLALPMRYIAGKMMVVRAITGAYSLDVIAPTGNPFEALPAKTDKKARPYDFIPLTPYQAAKCVENSAKQLSQVGAVLIGGGQVSDALRKDLALARVKSYASFGMTETLSHFALASLSGDDDLVYKPMKGVEIKIRKNGLLRVKWKAITRNWLDTNDIVSASGKGFVWLGRNDHLINSGGVKVIPEQVEKKLAHLVPVPFFVAGIPHEKLGEEVALFIEAEGSLSRDLLSEVQHTLSDTPFWQPRRLVTASEFLYTPTGKIIREDTARRALEGENSKL